MSTDPAFPSGSHKGLTRREYAAIHLRVPDSGSAWLDAMIYQALEMEVALRLRVPETGRSGIDDMIARAVERDLADSFLGGFVTEKSPVDSQTPSAQKRAAVLAHTLAQAVREVAEVK